MYIRDDDAAAIARLWWEIADFPAAEPEEALAHGLGELARIIGASNAFWVGAVRDPARPADDPALGWRPRAVESLYAYEQRRTLRAELLRRTMRDVIDPQTQAIVAGAGTNRASLRKELVEDSVWKRSWLYNDILRPQAIEDRLLGSHVVDGLTESYIGLDRERRDKPFGERERDMLRRLVGAIGAIGAIGASALACMSVA